MKVSTLVTHSYPDLDAIVACWLLRRWGEERYPGVQTAPLEFRSAGILVDGESWESLEAQGRLGVDLGGGRFDAHLEGEMQGDEGELRECATSLVARDLGVPTEGGLGSLLEFVRRQDVEGRSLASRDATDHAFALVSVLRGFHLRNGEDFAGTAGHLDRVLDLVAAAGDSRAEILGWYRSFRPAAVRSGSVELVGVNPLDAVVALWLEERRSGEARWPVTAQEVEQAGTATAVVAARQGREDAPELAKILRYVRLERLQKGDGYLPGVDFWACVLPVLYGSFRQAAGDLTRAGRALFPYLDAVEAVEQDWILALEECTRVSRILTVGPRSARVRIVAFESSLQSSPRAVRFKLRPDLMIHRDGKLGTIGMTLRQARSPLQRFTFDGRGLDDGGRGEPRRDSVAARIRLAEALEWNEEPRIERLNDVGLVHGWFLHQSLRILAKGSRKAPDVPSSRIPLEDLTQLVASGVDPSRSLPTRWCTPERCRSGGCRFLALGIRSCAYRASPEAGAGS